MRFFKTKIGIAVLVLAAVLGFVYFVLPRLKKTTTAPTTTPTADPVSKPPKAPKVQLATLASPTVFYSNAN